MKITELEKLIEGQREHPGLDFKAACVWDVKKLTKDILAMSNLPDGGYIVIGVEEIDNSFSKSGVDENVKNTYILDEMKDQVSKYADPMVDFEVYFPKDSEGLIYVVIKVFSFRETPTICKRDLDKELKASTIYYRNTNRRVESAAVSNVNDLRDIIELAAVRLMQRRRSFGFIVPDNNKLLEDNLDSVNQLPLVKEIKIKGYCEVNVIPLSQSNLQSLGRCLEVVEKAQVRLNWDFPFISRHSNDGNIETFEKGYQGISNLGSRKEIWRMHLSEHFYALNAFVEDWMEDDSLRGNFAKKFPSGDFFFFYTSLLHYLTQVCAFIERLATQGLYKEGARVSIRFLNMSNRQLYLDSDRRVPFVRQRSTNANEILIEEEYSLQELLGDSMKISNSMILKVSEYFQYTPSPDSILAEQVQFINNR